MRDWMDKNKTPLYITTLSTYLINSLLIISLLIKYFLCLFFSHFIKSFFPFSLQFLLRFYLLSFFSPKYHFPYTCFTKCSSKNIHGRSCKWHQTTKWGERMVLSALQQIIPERWICIILAMVSPMHKSEVIGF